MAGQKLKKQGRAKAEKTSAGAQGPWPWVLGPGPPALFFQLLPGHVFPVFARPCFFSFWPIYCFIGPAKAKNPCFISFPVQMHMDVHADPTESGFDQFPIKFRSFFIRNIFHLEHMFGLADVRISGLPDVRISG